MLVCITCFPADFQVKTKLSKALIGLLTYELRCGGDVNHVLLFLSLYLVLWLGEHDQIIAQWSPSDMIHGNATQPHCLHFLGDSTYEY